jgi:dihydrofolate reductase
MGKVVLYIAASIDGYIARENGAVDWLDLVAVEGEDYGYAAFYDSVDALIMGSKTYEEVVQVLSPGSWPYPGKFSHVLSSRQLATGNPEIVVTSQPLEDVVADLQANGKEMIWLVGGGALVAAMLAKDLIDEIMLFIIPLTLGSGLPLFPPTRQEEKSFELVEVKGYQSGVVQVRYRKQQNAP